MKQLQLSLTVVAATILCFAAACQVSRRLWSLYQSSVYAGRLRSGSYANTSHTGSLLMSIPWSLL